MSRTLFWDVDTQHDFMHADGKLYVPQAEEIIPTLAALTDYAHRRGIRIVASADDHVPGHRELSTTPDFKTTFPEHCMRGTPGQRKILETTLQDPLVIEPEADPSLAAKLRAHDGDLTLGHARAHTLAETRAIHGARLLADAQLIEHTLLLAARRAGAAGGPVRQARDGRGQADGRTVRL